MERLATHTLEITPGQAATGTSPCQAALRETRGPSLPGRIPSEQDGPSLCRAAGFAAIVRREDFSRGREYCTAHIGNSIPGCITLVPTGDFPLRGRTHGTGKMQRRKCCPRRVQLNIMAGFLDYTCALSLRIVSGNRAIPSGRRASRRFSPAGLGPAQRILNDRAVSVSLPFFYPRLP